MGVSTLAAVWAGLGWGVCVDQALSPCSPRRLKQPLEAAPPGSRSLWPPSSWVGSQQGPSPEPPTTYAQPAPALCSWLPDLTAHSCHFPAHTHPCAHLPHPHTNVAVLTHGLCPHAVTHMPLVSTHLIPCPHALMLCPITHAMSTRSHASTRSHSCCVHTHTRHVHMLSHTCRVHALTLVPCPDAHMLCPRVLTCAVHIHMPCSDAHTCRVHTLSHMPCSHALTRSVSTRSHMPCPHIHTHAVSTCPSRLQNWSVQRPGLELMRAGGLGWRV